MKVLVTGSSGYLGSSLSPFLGQKGYEVQDFDAVKGDDILDEEQVKRSTNGCDAIVHLAGIVGMTAVDKDVAKARSINVQGTANVVSCGLRVIFPSVLVGYEKTVIDETTPCYPKHPYYQQKMEAEKMVLSARKDNLALRFGSHYGVSPTMRNDLLVHFLMVQAMTKGEISLYQPEFLRPITNVQDTLRVIAFFLKGLELGGIYNVVSTNIPKREICREIQKVVGCKVIEDTQGKDEAERNYWASTKKIENLGFVFHPNLRKSIRELVKVLK